MTSASTLAGTGTPDGEIRRLSMGRVLLCGALILTLSMGIRHGFGLWLQPITMERGWTREAFSLAMAIQNLGWGLAAPLAGVMADRLGAFKVLMLGSLFYAAGLAGMAASTSSLGFALSAGVLIGMAQAGTTYAVVYGVIGRNVAPEKRSRAMGIGAAAGSFGQFLMVPVENALIASFGWQGALWMLAAAALVIIPMSFGLREHRSVLAPAAGASQSVAAALREAFGYRSFQLLMGGYFVCGFQVVFIGVHLPS
jgi:MFS family permease